MNPSSQGRISDELEDLARLLREGRFPDARIDDRQLDEQTVFLLRALRRVLEGGGLPLREWPMPGRTTRRQCESDARELMARLGRLEHTLESRFDALMQRPARCRLTADAADRLPQFLTATSTSDGDWGTSRFVKAFAEWFEGTPRCVIADPWLFGKTPEPLDDYVKGLAEIIGTSARRVDFYFKYRRDSYQESIAAALHAAVQQPKRVIWYYGCPDLHDRVWLRHRSLADRPPASDWSARVVGASANGIRKRPTYVVDMRDDDANDYSLILENLRAAAGQHGPAAKARIWNTPPGAPARPSKGPTPGKPVPTTGAPGPAAVSAVPLPVATRSSAGPRPGKSPKTGK